MQILKQTTCNLFQLNHTGKLCKFQFMFSLLTVSLTRLVRAIGMILSHQFSIKLSLAVVDFRFLKNDNLDVECIRRSFVTSSLGLNDSQASKLWQEIQLIAKTHCCYLSANLNYFSRSIGSGDFWGEWKAFNLKYDASKIFFQFFSFQNLRMLGCF